MIKITMELREILPFFHGPSCPVAEVKFVDDDGGYYYLNEYSMGKYVEVSTPFTSYAEEELIIRPPSVTGLTFMYDHLPKNRLRQPVSVTLKD